MMSKYDKLLLKEEYFTHWDKKDFSTLTEEMRDHVYQKYVMKFEVLNRDNFTCQNINGKGRKCAFCQNEQHYHKLTVHHFKAKRNGGENKSRNGVTLCSGSHDALNKGKFVIIYSNNPSLPAHIRGSSQSIDDEPQINWKEIKARMRVRRKDFRQIFGVPITEDQMEALMKFLFRMYDENV